MRRRSGMRAAACLLAAALGLVAGGGCIGNVSDGARANGVGPNTGADVGSQTARASATGPGATYPPAATNNPRDARTGL